jgi:hypothetical protein
LEDLIMTTKNETTKTEITKSSKIVAIKPRKRGGTKKKFHMLIPKKGGITVNALTTKAKKELEVPASKVQPWLKGFLRRGLIRVA